MRTRQQTQNLLAGVRIPSSKGGASVPSGDMVTDASGSSVEILAAEEALNKLMEKAPSTVSKFGRVTDCPIALPFTGKGYFRALNIVGSFTNFAVMVYIAEQPILVKCGFVSRHKPSAGFHEVSILDDGTKYPRIDIV
jgi:hypothetical protein